jgi:DNA-binding protein HU-beta
MTKAELIDAVASNADISKVAATKAVDSITTSVTKTLKKGGKVTLVGFGTFSVSKRKARKGRNPQTGEEIKIPASKTPKFSAGKSLKQAIN